MPETTFRLRVTYGKTRRLRYLSHLEVARACERSIRRADLPYLVTRGYTPRMKVAFGPALPVGTAGAAECYDVWLSRFVPVAEALERLVAVTPPGLTPQAAAYVRESEASLSAAYTVADYEVEVSVDPDRTDDIRRAMAAVLSDKELRVQHKGKDKVFDLATSLPKEPVIEVSGTGATVRLTVRMGESGSLRPEALVNAALERAGESANVSAVVRTDLRQQV